MPEDYEEFISLTHRMSSKRPSRMLARNWKHRWLLLCLARQARRVSMERPVARPMISNQNLPVSWKPVNPQDCVRKNLPNYQEDHIAGKGDNSLQHYNLVHNFFLIAQAMKIPAAKAAVDKESEKLEKILAWDQTKFRSKSQVQGRRAQKFILPHWWTSVIWKMLNWRQSTKNAKVELCTVVILWKMFLDLMQYSLNKDHQHLKWQQQKSWISYPDCQDAQDKQRAQYLLIPRSKW